MTFEELIIELQPFSDGLKQWCNNYPEFVSALKIAYPERFVTLQAVSTSSTPNYPTDEVIGVYAVDYGVKKPRIKQDFIVNKNMQDNEFVLYTGYPGKYQGRYIKHIKEFFNTYGKDSHYAPTHWPSFEQLPEEVKPRADRAIRKALELQSNGLRRPTRREIEETYRQFQSIQSGK